MDNKEEIFLKYYNKGYTACFDNALISFSIFYALKESQLDYYDGIIMIVKQLAFLASLTFSLLSILRNFRWNVYGTVAFSFLFFIPLYLRLSYHSNVLASTMLILAASNIPFSHVAKMCLKGILIVFFIVLGSLALGLVEDRLYFRDKAHFEKSNAHDLGFKYYSFAYLGMGIIQCCIYIWKKHMTYRRIIFLLVVSYLFFIVTSTRLQLYACAAFIVVFFAIPYIPKIILHSKILSCIAVVSYPVICILLYFLSKYFILSIFYDGYEELNEAMSNRLTMNEEAFIRYDVTLWGNNLELDGSETTTDYFYIDSGFLHVLLGDGLVYTAVILLLYSILTYKLFRSRAYYLYFWVLIYAILNISNGFLVALLENPILLLAFSDTKAISFDYELAKDIG
jgi:hypothetical protein